MIPSRQPGFSSETIITHAPSVRLEVAAFGPPRGPKPRETVSYPFRSRNVNPSYKEEDIDNVAIVAHNSLYVLLRKRSGGQTR
jgi:hypothetical protein